MKKTINQSEQEKLKDFKKLYSFFVNPNQEPILESVVDALFLNVEKFYLEFKDDVPYVSVKDEQYPFHLLQPKDGKYQLLDFLINRAITNAERIVIGKENCFDASKVVEIDADRYKRYENSHPKQFIDKQKLKSKLHETSHALKGIDYVNDGCIHLSKANLGKGALQKRIITAQNALGRKYLNLLKLNKVNNAKEKFSSEYLASSFNDTICSEGSTEMYAVLFSGLISETANVGMTKVGNGKYVICPNKFNGYSPFQRFFYHLRNNVSKEAMFSSLFLGTQAALVEFAQNNAKEIEIAWEQSSGIKKHIEKMNTFRRQNQITEIPTDTPVDKLKALLLQASYDFIYSKNIKSTTEESQEILDKLFLSSYKKKISTSSYTPEEMKNQLGIAFNLSVVQYDPITKLSISPPVRKEYLELYKKMQTICEMLSTSQTQKYSNQKTSYVHGMSDAEIEASRKKLGIK